MSDDYTELKHAEKKFLLQREENKETKVEKKQEEKKQMTDTEEEQESLEKTETEPDHLVSEPMKEKFNEVAETSKKIEPQLLYNLKLEHNNRRNTNKKKSRVSIKTQKIRFSRQDIDHLNVPSTYDENSSSGTSHSSADDMTTDDVSPGDENNPIAIGIDKIAKVVKRRKILSNLESDESMSRDNSTKDDSENIQGQSTSSGSEIEQDV